MELAAELVVGARVRLTLPHETVEGEVYAYDEVSNCVVLQTALEHTTLKRALRVVQGATVSAMEIVERSDGAELPQLPAISERRLREREAEAERKVAEAVRRVGVGVSRTAQLVFDALCKTLPCEWRGTTIVVLDEIELPEPYTPTELAPMRGSGGATLSRVRKVLEGELKKLRKKQQQEAAAAAGSPTASS